MVKYVRNSFLAVKVSYFNEIYELCRQMEINYDNIRSATIIDDRIGKSHTKSQDQMEEKVLEELVLKNKCLIIFYPKH